MIRQRQLCTEEAHGSANVDSGARETSDSICEFIYPKGVIGCHPRRRFILLVGRSTPFARLLNIKSPKRGRSQCDNCVRSLYFAF